jgi:NifB/MoaA-like Fe-S oxidoreductase
LSKGNFRSKVSNVGGQKICPSTGLLPGQDLLAEYKKKKFLDDLTVEEVVDRLKVSIVPVNDIEKLIEACMTKRRTK